MSRTRKTAFAGAAVLAIAMAAGAGIAWAQQLNPGISCLRGSVPGNDYAELTSVYKESLWDNKAGIRVRTTDNYNGNDNDNDDRLTLTVTDNYDVNVCEASGDTKLRCRFSFSASYSGIFNVRLSNSSMDEVSYRLCAE